MIPVLICVPVLVSGRTGFTCFLPNIIVLQVHTLLLCLLVIVSVLVNAIDTELNAGYFLHCLTVLGTLAFLTLGIMGYRRVSERLLMAAFFIWCFVWFGYLLVSIFSVSNRMTLEVTSVNGRCPINFWILDWCKKVQSLHQNSPKNKTEQITMHQEIENVNKLYTDQSFYLPEKERALKETESISADKNIPNVLTVPHGVISLTDVGGYQAHTPSPEHKIQMAYITGIFLVLLLIMYIYSMYGYVLLKILNQIKTTPIFIIARVRDSEQGGQDQTEETTPTQNDKK